MTLTLLQQSFAQHYAVSRNATKAWIAAGGSAKGAAQAGSRALKSVEVRARVDDLVEGTMREVRLTREKVVLELMRIAFGDIREVVGWDEDGVHILNSETLTADAAHVIKKVKVKQEREWKGLGEEKEPWDVMSLEVEFVDRLGALKLLMEYTETAGGRGGDGSPGTFAGHPISVVVERLTAHYDLGELKRLDKLLDAEVLTVEHQEVSTNGSAPHP